MNYPETTKVLVTADTKHRPASSMKILSSMFKIQLKSECKIVVPYENASILNLNLSITF